MWHVQRSHCLKLAEDGDTLIPRSRWIAIHFELSPRQVEDPIFRDAGAGIGLQLSIPIQPQTGVGDFDHEMRLGCGGMASRIVARSSGNHDEVRLRLTPRAEDQRQLPANVAARPKGTLERLAGTPDSSGMGWFLRAH